MTTSPSERAVVAAAVVYLLLFGWAVANTSYDTWGALIAAPVLATLGVLGVRRMFTGDLQPMARVMYIGLGVKLLGVITRYFVAFDAYGGSTDAVLHHREATEMASAVWAGDSSIWSVIPSGTGTPFFREMTALIFVFVGTSQIAGYLIFAFMAFWGVAFFVKAACVAVPGLEMKRYAWFCVLAPSLVYWPSSIGKEAMMLLFLGLATYGIARLFARQGVLVPTLYAVIGLGLTGAIRPHLSGIWLAGLLPALMVALVWGLGGRAAKKRAIGDRVVLALVIGLAVAAFLAVSGTTMRYLSPSEEDGAASPTDQISAIIAETTRRTEKMGSTFRPPAVDSPADWPTAVVRTLTRPLLIEADNTFQLLTAMEITLFLIICLFSVSRVMNLPRMVLTNPYVAFAMTTLFLGGLAYSSFANLGVLARQKSLLFPLLLLIPCLATLPSKWERKRERAEKVTTETTETAVHEHEPAWSAVENWHRHGDIHQQPVATGAAPTTRR